MATATKTVSKVELPGIHPKAFEHPLDRTALEALRKTPGLDLLLKKLSAVYIERIVRLAYTANSLRMSPKQCPRIYELLGDACRVLDMKEPELYLMQQPFPNAFAIGMEKHTIVLTSGLVELLNEDELRGVIGHELGHIKSGHMLYRTMALFLAIVGLIAVRNLPFLSLITEALKYALYDWYRKSELSADRAGLLVTQDSEVSVRILLKLAAGPVGANHKLNEEEFLKQADEFEDMGSSILDAFYAFEMMRFQTHPFPALRAREIKRWSETEEYRGILQGEYPRVDSESQDRRCPKCAALIWNPVFRYCPECGAHLE